MPDEVFFCKFNTPDFTALEAKKGSRFVLAINAINSPYFQKNYNSGKNVSTEIKEDAQKAEISIYHSPEKTSYIKIPISLKN